MDKDKLYFQAEKIKFLVYEIESLAKILKNFQYDTPYEINENDMTVLVKLISRKSVTLSKMCCRHAYNIEQAK